MAAKDANVSWFLNFRVCMLLKRAVRMAFKEQGIFQINIGHFWDLVSSLG